MYEKDFDWHAHLSSLPPEERSRFLRTSCLLHLSEYSEYIPGDSSYESELNRATVDDQLVGDRDTAPGVDIAQSNESVKQKLKNALEVIPTTKPQFGDAIPAGPWSGYGYPGYIGPTIDDLPYEPEGRVILRPYLLQRETPRLYNASSFLMWRYGVCFNTHVIILPRLMGLGDHRDYTVLMSAWNKAVQKFLAGDQRSLQRKTRRTSLVKGPHPHLWMYVWENGLVQGLHAHQLCVIPVALKEAFSIFTRNWWEMKACMSFPAEAIFIRCENETGKNAHAQHVRWVRYILKYTHNESGVVDAHGTFHSLREILSLEKRENMNEVYLSQLSGASHNISKGAQTKILDRGRRQDRFQSALQTGQFDKVFSGWELDDFFLRSLDV